ncbi:MAG TPA: hypothetical protein VHZ96_19395 [Frankiaceae bacterium]|nr:hypothetical protein [Frankiaceae bacterium]
MDETAVRALLHERADRVPGYVPEAVAIVSRGRRRRRRSRTAAGAALAGAAAALTAVILILLPGHAHSEGVSVVHPAPIPSSSPSARPTGTPGKTVAFGPYQVTVPLDWTVQPLPAQTFAAGPGQTQTEYLVEVLTPVTQAPDGNRTNGDIVVNVQPVGEDNVLSTFEQYERNHVGSRQIINGRTVFVGAPGEPIIGFTSDTVVQVIAQLGEATELPPGLSTPQLISLLLSVKKR